MTALFLGGCYDGESSAVDIECREQDCREAKARALIEASKEAVRQVMKDPKSAEFRDVKYHAARWTNPPVVCGEVNAKNSYGAMAGFERFVYVSDKNEVRLESSVDDFRMTWWIWCERPEESTSGGRKN
ncbi:hypothetical protein [Methyloversatilis sp.]|uniref:hypothetical protein n=1 Tax=Methyloversatilis sp. TaxID=2569862 RepID=UPI003D2B05E2